MRPLVCGWVGVSVRLLRLMRGGTLLILGHGVKVQDNFVPPPCKGMPCFALSSWFYEKNAKNRERFQYPIHPSRSKKSQKG